MGGHGGLNILPQKRWNVYNYENREKVRRDEEAAAREEQLKQEQARKRDAEFRLERLRAAKGLAPLTKPVEHKVEQKEKVVEEPVDTESQTGHINLFQGINIFDPIEVPKSDKFGENEQSKRKKMKKEEAALRVITPEDDKYRLGYGVAGKGVKLPWYMEKRDSYAEVEKEGDGSASGATNGVKKRSNGKKSLQELREERLQREKQEKERQRALLMEKSRRDGGFSRRR